MSRPLRLIVFDVDGTLVDSQGDIVAAMSAAFDAVELPVPDRATLLSIVGLSLDRAMPRLAPQEPAQVHERMVAAYKDAYVTLRRDSGTAESSPLYPGAFETLTALSSDPHTLLGVATGKSQRGLDKLIEAHDLSGFFVTRQVADHHPSKPHPSMIWQAMRDAGVDARDTVMIGDTSFDMQMARSAGVGAIGVSWGYHPRAALTDAHVIIDCFAELNLALDTITERLV